MGHSWVVVSPKSRLLDLDCFLVYLFAVVRKQTWCVAWWGGDVCPVEEGEVEVRDG